MSKEKGIVGVVVGAVVAVGFTVGCILAYKHSRNKERLSNIDHFRKFVGNGVGFGCTGCGSRAFDRFEGSYKSNKEPFEGFEDLSGELEAGVGEFVLDYEEKELESDINEELAGEERLEEEGTIDRVDKLIR